MTQIQQQPGGTLRTRLHPDILKNAVRVSLLVGTLLNGVNQGQRLWQGQGLLWGQALLNYLVPFCVSAYSGAKARSRGGSSEQEEN